MTTESAAAQTTAPTQPAPTAAPQAVKDGGSVQNGAQKKDAAPQAPAVDDFDYDREVETVIDGEKQKVPIKKLIRDYQKYSAAERRLMTASEQNKAVEKEKAQLRQFVQTAKNNPALALSRLLGSDDAVKKFAEDYIWSEIQKSKKTPEQIELERYRADEHQRKADEAANKELSDREQAQQRVEQLRERYDSMFTEALQKTNLPKTAETVERMSKIYMSALKQGYEPSMDEVMDEVEQSYLGDIKSLLGGLTGERLYKMLGEDLWKKAREYDVSRLASPTPQRKSDPQPAVNVSKQDDRMSIHDAKALWRQRAGL